MVIGQKLTFSHTEEISNLQAPCRGDNENFEWSDIPVATVSGYVKLACQATMSCAIPFTASDEYTDNLNKSDSSAGLNVNTS